MTSATTALSLPNTQVSVSTDISTQAPSLTIPEFVKILGEFINSGLGSHRLYQVCSTAYKWTVQLNPTIVGAELDAIHDRIKTADNVGIFPKLFNTTKNLVNNWEAYQFERARPDPNQNTLSTRCRKVAMDVIDWAGDFSRTLLIGFPNHFGCMVTGTVSDLVLDVRDFGESIAGVRRSNDDIARLQNATAEERRRPVEEGRAHYLKIAKAICSFIGNSAAMGTLVVGAAVLPPLATLVVATTTLFFALWKQFYSDTMTHVLAQRMRERQVELQSA